MDVLPCWLPSVSDLIVADDENCTVISVYGPSCTLCNSQLTIQHIVFLHLSSISTGMLVTEEPIEYHPLFEAYNKDIGPAIRHLDEVRAVSPFFFEVLAIVIGTLELNRAVKGFKSPEGEFGFQDLKDE